MPDPIELPPLKPGEPVIPPTVSPTGKPVLPPEVAKWAGPLVLVAAALTMAPDMGIVLPAALVMYAKLGVLIGTVLGIYSPGARK